MKNVKEVEVTYNNRVVGRIAEYKRYQTAFEYDPEWISSGFSISPITLPLDSRLFISEYEPFNGLFGVFDDHLPDGWGRLMTDRYLRRNGQESKELTELTRLTLLSSDSFGGLKFKPSQYNGDLISDIDFDKAFKETEYIAINMSEKSQLDDIFKNGGLSGGAKPKLNVLIDNSLYLVKFPFSGDSLDMGKMEFDYLNTASLCGLDVPQSRLIESKYTLGFLATKHFDRPSNAIHPHMISLSGILEISHRVPALDYAHLFKVSYMLSKSIEQLEYIFRVMCFNFYAMNMDDHGKNFTFMRDFSTNWRLSPSYDLTKSIMPYGERATTINGKGKDITIHDLLSYADMFNLDRNKMKNIAEEIETIVHQNLGKYIS